MEDLLIQKTTSTFEINGNVKSGILEIEGNSYPEDVVRFFEPIYDWLETFLATGAASDTADGISITLNFRISYFNSSSSKCLFDLLDMLEEYHEGGGSVKINWYYEEDDPDMMTMGEEFCEDFDLDLVLVPVSYR